MVCVLTSKVEDVRYSLGLRETVRCYKFMKREIKEMNKIKLNIWIDDEGYKYHKEYNTHNDNYKQRRFHPLNPYNIDNINNYIKMNNINVKLLTTKYTNNDTKMDWMCECGNEFQASWHHFRGAGQYKCKGCNWKKCHEWHRYTYDDVKKEVEDMGYTLISGFVKIGDDISIEDKDGYKYQTTMSRLRISKKLIKYFVANPYTEHNIKKYLKDTNNSCELISIGDITKQGIATLKCECGEIFTRNWSKFMSEKRDCCMICSGSVSSYERKTHKLLRELQVKYIAEHNFIGYEELKTRYLYDFYLPEYNAVIECHGSQHYEMVEWFGGEEGFKSTQYRDKVKKDFCINNNIKYLEIPYYNFNDDSYIDMVKQFINK